MSIYQRGTTWWCDFATPDGQRVKRSLRTTNKKLAEELHDKLKHEMWRVCQIGDKQKRTFSDAALRWLKEKAHKQSLDDDKQKIVYFMGVFENITLDQITAETVRSAVANIPDHRGKPASTATKNRYLAFIRSLLRAAEKQWEWIDKSPTIALAKEPRRRIRWITPAEAQRLIDCIAEHWKPIVQFALATGLRKGNILGLRWDQIDMQRHVAWIHPDQAKAGKAIGVPLNQSAVDAITAQIGKHATFVFTHKGNTLRVDSQKDWNAALKKAGIENFRFHDLRHTWASWLVQSGVGLAELQEMGGWESVEMVRRYAHLAPDHLHKHAQNIDALLVGHGTFTEQAKPEKKMG